MKDSFLFLLICIPAAGLAADPVLPLANPLQFTVPTQEEVLPIAPERFDEKPQPPEVSFGSIDGNDFFEKYERGELSPKVVIVPVDDSKSSQRKSKRRLRQKNKKYVGSKGRRGSKNVRKNVVRSQKLRRQKKYKKRSLASQKRKRLQNKRMRKRYPASVKKKNKIIKKYRKQKRKSK